MSDSQNSKLVDAVAEVCAGLIRDGVPFRFDPETRTIVVGHKPAPVITEVKLSDTRDGFTATGEYAPKTREFPTPLKITPEPCQK